MKHWLPFLALHACGQQQRLQIEHPFFQSYILQLELLEKLITYEK